MHRAKLAGLPAFAALRWEAVTGTPQARHVVRADGALAHVLPSKGVMHGGRCVLPEPAGGRFTSLHSDGGVLAASVTQVQRLPPKVVYAQVWRHDVVTQLPGQSLALGGGVAVVLDADAKVLRALKADGTVAEITQVSALPDPQQAPVLSVSPDGDAVFFMDGHEACLERVRRNGERTRLLGPVPAPCWMVAAQSPSGRVLAGVMRLGETPSFQMLELRDGRAPRLLAEVAALQPCVAPVFVSENVAALLLCVSANAMTLGGPAQVVLLHLDGGAPCPLTSAEGIQGRLRFADGALLLEDDNRLGILERQG